MGEFFWRTKFRTFCLTERSFRGFCFTWNKISLGNVSRETLFMKIVFHVKQLLFCIKKTNSIKQNLGILHKTQEKNPLKSGFFSKIIEFLTSITIKLWLSQRF